MPGLPAASAKPVLPGMDLPVWPPLPDDHDGLDDSLDDMSDEDINALLDEIIVTEKDWTNTHPNMIKCGSDKFYARFANSLQMLLVMECRLPDEVSYDVYKEVSLTIAAYLEDFVSGFGVWNAIRSIYRKTYGRQLPFFDCEYSDYFDDDINIEDVKFLVWQTFCRIGHTYETVYSPGSMAVERFAQIAYDELVEAVDKAPEAKRVDDYIRKVLRKGDFFEVRDIAKWLVCFNKLTSAPYVFEDMLAEAENIANSTSGKLQNVDMGVFFYNVTCTRSLQPYSGPLGCHPSVYIAEMCRQRGLEDLACRLDRLDVIPFSDFEVKEIKGGHVILKAPDGVEYNVVKNSFGPGMDFKFAKTILASIVRFGEEWYQNGLCTASGEVIDKEDGLREMTYNSTKMLEHVRKRIEVFGGRKVFYCAGLRAVSEITGLKYSQKKDDGNEIESNDPVVLFLSETDGMVVLRDYTECFKDKANPYYDKKVAEDRSLALITNCTIPDDVAVYIADNKLLPDASMAASQGKRYGKKIVQDNLRFLCGFFRTPDPAPEYED